MPAITLVRRGGSFIFRVELNESFSEFLGTGVTPFPHHHFRIAVAESEGAQSTLVLQEHIQVPGGSRDERFIYELAFTAANALALCSTDLEWSKEATDESIAIRPNDDLLKRNRQAVLDRIRLIQEQIALIMEVPSRPLINPQLRPEEGEIDP